ncbi:MAG: class I tRNA ligase family protein, partial [Candidatus Woesearchaeota archaeon]
SDPYKQITQDYIDAIWHLIKQANLKERLYLGEKTMLWCPETESALAKHEVVYKEIKDDSIFLKFKKEGKDNEYFIIWTTTPWTIPLNLAIMVNPDMEYVDCTVTITSHEDKSTTTETWTVCKDLAAIFLSNVDDISFEIGTPYLGAELEGQKYIHPWEHFNPDIAEIKKTAPKLFSVLLSKEYVDSSAGTGLVHCAPGCGPEDYEVGIRNGIPAYNIIDEKGVFPDRIEKYKGLVAKKDDKQFVKLMKQDGFLIKSAPIEHEYPFSERGGVPVVFRTTKQWFLKVEDLKEQMLALNKDVNWHPQTAKNAFNSWLDNLRDNSITKQRIWGTPAPIWVHYDADGNVDEHIVIGSKQELETLATKPLPENLHKPWIDSVEIKSPETGNILTRIPDVLDVWIDAGCASWASLRYPQQEGDFKRYFPADYINEGKDQIRGWFNMLMVAGLIALDTVPFKNVGMHGFIAGVDGEKMSKSLGNVIQPNEVIEKTSTDNFRYYFSKTKAGEDISFSWEQLQLHQRHLTILWNTVNYYLDTVSNSDYSFDEAMEKGKELFGPEETYIISKTHSTVKEVTTLFEQYKLDEIPEKVSGLFLSISRDYIKAVRDKLGTQEEMAVIYALHESLTKTLQLFAPICPFITEMAYTNIKEALATASYAQKDYAHESIHQSTWPTYDASMINKDAEERFENSLIAMTGILAAREKAQINVRQPLQKAILLSKLHLNEAMLIQQTNIKQIDVVEDFDKLEYKVKANFKELGKEFGQDTATIGTALNQLSMHDAKLMKETFDADKSYTLTIEGKEYSITQNHVSFDIAVCEPFVMAEFPKGIAILDTTLTEDLKNEGLARELTRRIQNERKNLGLVKKDVVNLKLENEDLFEKIKPFLEDIKATCGIKELTQGPGDVEIAFKDITAKITIEKL